MTDREKEVEKKLLKNERQALEQLKETYAQALADIKAEVKTLQKDIEMPSKIYQLKYQLALEEQLNDIMQILSDSNITTVDDFLTEMYKDGYTGVMYSLQGMGVPLAIPIDQALLVKAVTKETAGIKLSTRLYNNVDKFKKDIISEISRGIASNAQYKDIALSIALKGQTSFSNAYRIAKTEGQRVAIEAKADNLTRLRALGADLVKQWDATLDNHTRPAHAKLHGQWIEDGELFTTVDDKYGEVSAPYPHGFGLASLDINCRCTLLARPRWAVSGGSYTHLDNITDETIEASSFAEWINKYHADSVLLNKKYSKLLGGE